MCNVRNGEITVSTSGERKRECVISYFCVFLMRGSYGYNILLRLVP